MAKFLLKNGKFAAKAGRLIVVDDPDACDCCGKPPPQNTCVDIERIKVEWGSISLSRVYENPAIPTECGGDFDYCAVGNDAAFASQTSKLLCQYKNDPVFPGKNHLVLAAITDTSINSEQAQFPNCIPVPPDGKGRIQGGFFIQIYTVPDVFSIAFDRWRQYYTVDSDIKEGDIEATLVGPARPEFNPSAFGGECEAAMQDYWNKPPKVTVTLKARRRALPPPMENPFP